MISDRIGRLEILRPFLISQSDFSLTRPFMSLTDKMVTTNSAASFYCKIASNYKRLVVIHLSNNETAIFTIFSTVLELK